jgi:hypothetical protein
LEPRCWGFTCAWRIWALPGLKLSGSTCRWDFRTHHPAERGVRAELSSASADVGVLDRQPTKGSTRSRWMWPRRDR